MFVCPSFWLSFDLFFGCCHPSLCVDIAMRNKPRIIEIKEIYSAVTEILSTTIKEHG